MPEHRANENWYTYFPEDYRWSAAICGMVSCAPWGMSEIGEVDKVGRRLAKKLGDDNAWFREWVRMADHVRDLGLQAERKGYKLTAASHHRRACGYYQMGERFRTPKDKAALAAYRKSLDCFNRYIRLVDRPRIERVEIPFEKGKKLPAYLVHAENTRKAKPPVVVFFDGLDITKELQYMRGVEDLARRGISCLCVDGPGNGESIRFRGMYLRHDYETAGTAALDYLCTRKDVNPRKAAVMGISLGAFFAPRVASFEHRYKACVSWGANFNYQETWRRRIAAMFKTELSVPGHHIKWILNAKDYDDVLEKLSGFPLDGVVQKMRCSYLIVHGADDKQEGTPVARKLYKASGSKDKTLKIFSVKEGGSQHCQRDNMSLGTTFIYDWLMEKLKP